MNENAQRLGMTQTSYVNPNGLPADGQITSARDLAILARAIIRDLPEYEYFYHIPSIRFGRRVTNNFNHLIGRYPGADGFKTGFICASGYNLVGSATRNGKRLIAVVLGSTSGHQRAVRAAQLLERGFASTGNGLGWLRPSLGTVDNLVPIDASPPNLRDEMCGGKRKRPASDEDAESTQAAAGNAAGSESPAMFFTAGLQPPMPKASDMLAGSPAASEPMVVYTGPKKTGTALIAAVATDTEKQTPAKRGKRSRVAAVKPDAGAAPKTAEAKTSEAKPAEAKPAKPAVVRHASAKPDAVAAKPAAAKPAATADKPAATAATAAPKPAKPKAAAKPKTETKPAG
jgi:D-alanyl-D-alanine carboxypeptidase